MQNPLQNLHFSLPIAAVDPRPAATPIPPDPAGPVMGSADKLVAGLAPHSASSGVPIAVDDATSGLGLASNASALQFWLAFGLLSLIVLALLAMTFATWRAAKNYRHRASRQNARDKVLCGNIEKEADAERLRGYALSAVRTLVDTRKKNALTLSRMLVAMPCFVVALLAVAMLLASAGRPPAHQALATKYDAPPPPSFALPTPHPIFQPPPTPTPLADPSFGSPR